MTGFVIFVVVMIVLGLVNKAKQQSGGKARQNARAQAMMARIQAQQGNQPVQFQGQFTQPAGQGGPPPPPPAAQGQLPGQAPGQSFPVSSFPVQAGTAQGSQQAAAVLQALLQNGRRAPHAGEWTPPGQPAVPPGQYPAQYNPGPYNPGPYNQAPYNQAPYQPGPYQPPAHRPPQNNLPTSKQDLDARVRELMNAGNEVGAVRLLSQERELGILEAQQYARGLVAPQSARPGSAVPDEAAPDTDATEQDEERYVGSAAFAESIFNLDDREENVWASGWVDTPEPEDRSDIDELWQTVNNPPRPAPPTAR